MTAPVWQSFADILVDNGHPVAVIGHAGGGDMGIVEIDRSRCLDLVDKLSVEELIALVGHAGVLVASDSAAVQIAGAFDTWIGLVASTMNPEHVLAWRQGSQFFHARVLGERPERAGVESADPSLPAPTAVLQFIREALADG